MMKSEERWFDLLGMSSQRFKCKMKSMGQFEYCASIRFPAFNKSTAECNRYAAPAPGPTTIAKTLYTAIINDLHFKKEKVIKI